MDSLILLVMTTETWRASVLAMRRRSSGLRALAPLCASRRHWICVRLQRLHPDKLFPPIVSLFQPIDTAARAQVGLTAEADIPPDLAAPAACTLQVIR
mmetsp:Transcript_89279/g.140970  ORF Transcript_89279/g.140970 Transcript_89279/m.140970 type:complete len:98 (-) Transcript_89279:62-355(-)